MTPADSPGRPCTSAFIYLSIDDDDPLGDLVEPVNGETNMLRKLLQGEEMVGLGHLNESQFEKEVKLRFSFRPQAFRFKASAHGAVRWLTYQQPARPFVPMKTGRSNSRSRRSEDATLTDRPREDQHDRGVGMIHTRYTPPPFGRTRIQKVRKGCGAHIWATFGCVFTSRDLCQP